MKKEQSKEQIEVKYKIRMVVEIEGCLDGCVPLRDDSGIEPFIQWASDDIEEKLECVCDIKEVQKIELEKV